MREDCEIGVHYWSRFFPVKKSLLLGFSLQVNDPTVYLLCYLFMFTLVVR
jgi:hypothetical protein